MVVRRRGLPAVRHSGTIPRNRHHILPWAPHSWQIPPACGWVQGSDTSSLWVSTGVRFLQLVGEYRGQIPPACGRVQGSDFSSLWVSTGIANLHLGGWVHGSDTYLQLVSTRLKCWHSSLNTRVRCLQLVGEYNDHLNPTCRVSTRVWYRL